MLQLSLFCTSNARLSWVTQHAGFEVQREVPQVEFELATHQPEAECTSAKLTLPRYKRRSMFEMRADPCIEK